MGRDCFIFVKLRPGCAQPRVEYPLPDGFLMVAPCVVGAPENATHEVRNHLHYYSSEYPRGPWPRICHVLMILLNSPDIETVWYGTPGWGLDRPFDVHDLMSFTAYFVQFGCREWCGDDAMPVQRVLPLARSPS